MLSSVHRLMQSRWVHTSWVQQLFVFAICMLVLLRTVAPSVYAYDSAEFPIGAARLGIIHAPGYPLYLLIAHIFTWLPFGDVAYRVNLLSAVCLALTAPVLFSALSDLTEDRAASAFAALMLVWSYYVWVEGVRAETYSAQLLTLALVLWWFALMYKGKLRDIRHCLIAGLLVGLAMAMHPGSVFLAPGIAAAFLVMKIPFKRAVVAGLFSVMLFAVIQLYFPIRYLSAPAINIAGQYDGSGVFVPVDLTKLEGIIWMLRAAQFKQYFALVPSLTNVVTTLQWYVANFLGVGILLGLFGLWILWQEVRGLFYVWLISFVPITYFFTAYTVVDRDSMFGPSYLVWTVALAFGAKGFLTRVPGNVKATSVIVLLLVALIINFPLVNVSQDRSIRDHAQVIIAALPPNAIVFGRWFDIVPLQYLQIVEGQRSDLTLLNLFLFQDHDLATYLQKLSHISQPVLVVGEALPIVPNNLFTVIPFRLDLPSFDGMGIQNSIAGYKLLPINSG